MNNYELVRNIATLLIEKLRGERSITPEDISQQVDLAIQSPGAEPLSDVERKKLIAELEYHYQTVIGVERELLGDDEGWGAWIPDRRAEIGWKYWDRYRKYLSRKSFPQDVLNRLETSTDRVLGLLGDPTREGAWDRRGLVVGLVQSGKTAHYVGTINKAVDAGYKVIVVLTGFTESLRVQTQDRLEQGLLGYSLRPHPDDKKKQVAVSCGVDLISRIKPRLDSVTTCRNDFKTAIAMNFAIGVGGNPIVFVIKKNATVLKNLLQWLNNFGTDKDEEGRTFVRGIPLLVIDDESDVGSIDTKKGGIDEVGDGDPEHDPTKLNKQIRKLLSIFEQSSYVGYTATPFANVLIHDAGKTGIDKDDGLLIGEDLFPRSFIVSLPTPSNHVGPTMVFGTSYDDDEPSGGLPIVRVIEDTEVGGDPADYWMPKSHKKDHVPLYYGEERVPDSLRDAILSFILVIAARRLRGDGDKHNSMLVHVTRFNDTQGRVFEQIERERQDILNRLRNKTGDSELRKRLREIWEIEENSFMNTTRQLRERPDALFQNPVHSWEEISEELKDAAGSIEVRMINGTAGDVLDYEDNQYGLNVIAIGGDKLARGLTLEGLSISYFLRCSKMYDTLMQMGRWFGYRPGYLDLCRLYTTEDLSNWFAHIADATEELRGEFDLMANSGRTPKHFGLKVKSHPTMMVTSSVKMRYGQELQISFQGSFVQTIDFSRKRDNVRSNWNAAVSLIKGAEAHSGVDFDQFSSGKAMWTGVPGGLVSTFLENYCEHKKAVSVRTKGLQEYVESQMKRGNLVNWTVLLSGKSESKMPAELSDASVGCLDRAWNAQDAEIEMLKNDDHYRIKVISSSADERVDLEQGGKEWGEALELDISDWEATDHIRRGKEVDKPSAPGGRFVRQVRSPENGLLILYPLLPHNGRAEEEDTPILGFSISFPTLSDDGVDTPVTYVVSNIYQQLEMDFDV